MSITASVPSAASIGAYSSEIATAKAGAGDYDTALSGIPAPTAATKLLYDNGTAYVETAAGTAAQVPVVNAGATAPVYVSISGDATLAATGALTVTYAALGTDRSVGAPGSFRIKSLLADGTINVADVSTVDWIAFG